MEKMKKLYSPRMFQGDLMDEMPVINLNQIKKGDIFYECEKGVNIQMEALDNAKRLQNGWLCKVKTNKGVMSIYSSATTKVYEPNLYRYPYYLTVDDKNHSFFVVE